MRFERAFIPFRIAKDQINVQLVRGGPVCVGVYSFGYQLGISNGGSR